MIRFDATRASVEILTEKEGLLGAAGHDLRLRATDLVIEIDEATGAVDARVGAAGVHLVAARQGECDRPEILGESDRRSIERSLHDEVLAARRHPEIRFRATAVVREPDALRIEGTLSLRGVERPLALTARRDGGEWSAEVPIDQPSFGIKPFSALFGTLRVKPRVLVRVRVPAT